MDVGVIVPQGFTGEYDGTDPLVAWERSHAIARLVEELGFESIWLFDHFYQEFSADGFMLEGFSMLSALAAVTERVRLGHVVACAGYRNAALTAKMIATIDVISGGRAELGLGAGWHRLEYEAFGYDFPSLRDRQERLADTLEIARRMLGDGRATYAGRLASADDARNVPRGVHEPRVPIIVGGNGQEVTWRLAARYADELNLDGPSAEQMREWMPVIRSRCEEIDRDPDDLRVSVFLWWGNTPPPGPQRADWLAQYRETGVSRIMGWVPGAARSDEAIVAFRDDVRAAGLTLADDRP